MFRTKLLPLIAALATVLAGPALASDIYRYTDAEGNIHYVDRPTGDPTEERVAIVSKRSALTQTQARSEPPPVAGAPAEQESSSGEGAAEPKKLTRAEKKAAAQEKAQKCQRYRDQLETLVTSRRLYREDDSGERVYLNDDETQEARNRVQELIVENCG